MTVPIVRESGVSTTDGTSQDTGTWTPTANETHVAWLLAESTGGAGSATLDGTGNGVTWVLVSEVAIGSYRLSCFRCNAGASPSSGVSTFDTGADTMRTWGWSIESSPSWATGNNGGDAIKSANTKTASGSSVTTLDVTFVSAFDAGNETLCAHGHQVNETTTKDSNMTVLSDLGLSSPDASLMTQAKAGEEATCTVTWTTSNTNNCVGIALEMILAAVGATLPLATVAATAGGPLGVAHDLPLVSVATSVDGLIDVLHELPVAIAQTVVLDFTVAGLGVAAEWPLDAVKDPVLDLGPWTDE